MLKVQDKIAEQEKSQVENENIKEQPLNNKSVEKTTVTTKKKKP